jgi:D-3-phosphoglycerate dehydrogenase
MVAFDPFVESEGMQRCGVEKVSLEELLRRSDLISVHVPLNERTRHLLGRKQFDLMKPGVVLVNTSRGPVVDGNALADAVRSGKLWGAGLDVMEEEPLPADSPLRELENVTFTPHVGANSEQSRTDLYRSAVETASDVLDGRWPSTVVNPEVRPWFPIAASDTAEIGVAL